MLGVRCDDDIFKLTASAQVINREVCAIANHNFGDNFKKFKWLIYKYFIYVIYSFIAEIGISLNVILNK